MAEGWIGWPGWEGAHPLVVHFPVAWLVAAAACLAATLVVSASRSLALLRGALALLLASAVASLLAMRSGAASASVVALPLGAEPLLAQHERLGTALVVLIAVLSLFVGIALRAVRLDWWGLAASRRRRLALAALLAAHVALLCLTAATAHLGGRLVHELGVRAWAPLPAPPAESGP